MNQVLRKSALITGATGQDGAYLAELLLSKGYVVHGIKRRSSSFNTAVSITSIMIRTKPAFRFHLHYGDVTDTTNLIRVVQETQPTRSTIWQLSRTCRSRSRHRSIRRMPMPIGTLRLLEAIRILGLEKRARFYQASTSELYGNVQEIPQKETTPFYPRSPYALAKLYAHWITVNYREAYGMHASNGILFNHESPDSRRNFRDAKDHSCGGRHRAGVAGDTFSWQPECEERLGSRT